MPNTLPTDPADWPRDPFRLLGIQPSDDWKTVRRSYTQLIRRFTPDRHPEQFQLIRAAFERIQSWMSQGQIEAIPPYYVITPYEPVSVGHSAAQPRTSSEPREDGGYWQLVLEGNLQRAYARLVQEQLRSPDCEDVCLQLYWLLSVEPALDATREPLNWLIAGIEARGLTCRLFAVLCDEGKCRPQVALDERLAALLTQCKVNSQLLEFAKWRWSIAVRSRNWLLIHSDMDLLRPRVQPGTPDWIRLLLAALNCLAWLTADPLPKQVVHQIEQELKQVPHSDATLAFEFERYDLLIGMTSNNWPASMNWRDILCELWLTPRTESHGIVLTLVEPWMARPYVALDMLDELTQSNPFAMHYLLECFSTLANTNAGPHDEASLRRLIDRFLRSSSEDYSKFRYEVLSFSLVEEVPVASICSAMIADGTEEFSQLAHRLSRDAALAGAVHGCRIDWSLEPARADSTNWT